MGNFIYSSSNTRNLDNQAEKPGTSNIAPSITNSKKYVGFDIEIAKNIGDDFSQWRSNRPLGITCAAIHPEGDEPMLWYDTTPQGIIAPKMSQEYACGLVSALMDWVKKGYQIFTWNGLGFDFDVLAEESNMRDECKILALMHVDMMFHFFCIKGFPLNLDKAAKGMGLSGKLVGITGEQAPLLWQQGQHERVLEYVAQDSRTTVELAKAVEKKHYLTWTSNTGNSKRVDFPKGWLIVEQASNLPLPDTAWMKNPISRNQFLAWTIKK